jgi:glycyl-tRNA synthetase beta chain
MFNDVLFELGCEELPSAAVWTLADTLTKQVVAALEKSQLSYTKVHYFATPRRLAFKIDNLIAAQPDQKISRRGPAISAAYDSAGNTTPALQGFAKSCGVNVDALTTLETPQGSWIVFEAVQAGAPTITLLPTIINQALAGLPIPKPMRWGNSDIEFARPVHWAVLLFGEQVVETTILGLTTDRVSYGHRFHHPKSIKITSASTYETQMLSVFVHADFISRRKLIKEQVQNLATTLDAIAIIPEDLLDEVSSIVEWPEALLANFDKSFLDVPAEALIAAMQSHQKCFALQDKKGKLLPHFITVANLKSRDPQQVISGNEKVMRARLSDAAFFFHLDQKQPLSARIPGTEKVVFQHRLGSLHDKSLRLIKSINTLVHSLDLNPEQASRAAELSKCDLLTGMVGEFPDLQGLMGCYYAQLDDEPSEVAIALKEQYLPRFAADDLPQSDLGLALSLADRMDTLVGIFAIGQKPTGVKDPFKLRRHALAVVRLLLKTPAPIQLSTLIKQGLANYGDILAVEKAAQTELKPFILERLQSYYQAQGITHDMLQAVLARQNDWIFDIDKRLQALVEFVKSPASTALTAACKRVNNILSRAGIDMRPQSVQEHLLQNDAELNLYSQLQVVEQHTGSYYELGSYGEILTQLSTLRDAVDAFFDQVMVMVDNEELKMNRIQLLIRLQGLLQGVADISLLSQS